MLPVSGEEVLMYEFFIRHASPAKLIFLFLITWAAVIWLRANMQGVVKGGRKD